MKIKSNYAVEQLIVRVADKEKAEMLLKILSALNFVTSVEVMEDNAVNERQKIK
ncbi:hypothetical protein [Nodularia sphaerocarpa]|uniref:hypothetical protein n=1 Tax=Nodularia sphaerocarpa TaxID=137816 RepID=UPI001EFBDECF|nr:hypothetical protein [Nodularia sphaerocarpa]MDB9373669.1 hypothetical protein [Nodularia sphaerocarpa CS-585]MDB9378664.1 hypothetical protein [Nodularia sphaerocarpa CS-585A2]ULP73023.1 hypothetical protein BDGGKGIB_02676 [Nodularia sphaerocarpa UHCC 0038]